MLYIHLTKQVFFFNVWKKHGLQHQPKIVLLETNQIIPDRNLFGHRQSRFGSDRFDVKIELATSPNPVNRKSNSTGAEMTQNMLDSDGVTRTDENNYLPSQPRVHVTTQNTPGEIASGYGELGDATPMSGDGNDFPTNPPRMGYQNKDGKFEHVKSMSGHASDNSDVNDSISASIDANRKHTNVMQEGYTDC